MNATLLETRRDPGSAVIGLYLVRNEGYAWQRLRSPVGLVHYKGNGWEIGRELTAWLAGSAVTIETLARLLAKASYRFAVVVEDRDDLWAAVDLLRTQPLFVGTAGGRVVVTDDPYAPATGLDTSVDDAFARAQFAMAGYPLGARTLAMGIRALQARETARITSRGGDADCRFDWLRPPFHEEPLADPTPAASVPAFIAVADEIFSGLCAELRGRQIAVPLSGGLDSRFVAAMLKRHGLQNVATFTYGRPGDAEVVASREAARKLGYSWEFVPYSRERWRRWFSSESMRQYLPFASRHVSTPHVQDWPAVMELKQRGVVQADAVFVPGHTAMVTANRLEPWVFELPDEQRLDALAEVLYRHHFNLRSAADAGVDARDVLKDIRSRLPRSVDGDRHRLLSAYFNFEAFERHAKLIVNSARVYEFFGHGWEIPLWDDRFARLWAQVPYTGRYGKRWVSEVLANAPLYGVFKAAPRPSLYSRLRQRTKETRLTYRPLKWLRDLDDRYRGYFRHPFAWYGIVGYRECLRRMPHGGSVYSILSDIYLERLDGRGDATPTRLTAREGTGRQRPR